MLNQLLNSFCLLNVSMAAKNRMHNFLDLVNTTSPQSDTSSHLNQSKATATKSAIFDIFGEVISTPGRALIRDRALFLFREIVECVIQSFLSYSKNSSRRSKSDKYTSPNVH